LGVISRIFRSSHSDPFWMYPQLAPPAAAGFAEFAFDHQAGFEH
jgi:hypothetical protein